MKAKNSTGMAPGLDDFEHSTPIPRGFADRRLMGWAAPLFGLASAICLLRHEMWRDEIEAWNIVLRSDSLSSLFERLRYVGHGALWYLSLYPMTRLTSSPVAMQLFHLALAITAATLILGFYPCSPLCRILLVFGYFPFFEYATISRNYGLAFLLVVLFCVVATRKPESILAQTLILVLLAQTQAYGLILAVALSAFLVANHLLRGGASRTARAKRRFFASALLLACGLLVGVQQLRPPTQATPFGGWYFVPNKARLLAALSTPWRALVPIPKIELHFWNTNFLDIRMVGSSFQPSRWEGALGIAVCVLLILLTARRPAALVFVVFALGGLLSFTYVKYVGDLRHHGFYWVTFVAAFWLWTNASEHPVPAGNLDRVVKALQLRWRPVLLGFSVCALVAGIAASTMDVLFTFSTSGQVARYLTRHFPSHPVVGDWNYIASPVAMHLNRPFYYPMGNRWGTFCIWDEVGTRGVNSEAVAQAVRRVAAEKKSDVMVLLSYPATGPLTGYQPIAVFPSGIVADEQYFLYLARFRP